MEYAIYFSVEFIKMLLVVTFIFQLQIEKKVNYLFAIALAVIISTASWFKWSHHSYLYGFVIILILYISQKRKRRILILIMIYSSISVIDVLFGILCTNYFGLNKTKLQDYSLEINCISLCIIVVISIFIKKRNRNKTDNKMVNISYLPVYACASIFFSYYLTAVMLVNLDKQKNAYQYEVTIGALAVGLVFGITAYLLMKNKNENNCLKLELHMNQKLLEAQNNYYSMMLQKEQETKAFRHDIRGHILCIKELYYQKKYDALGDYINQLENQVGELSVRFRTGSMYVDVILEDMAQQYDGVMLKWDGSIPALSVSSMDMCILFYNLLKNAYEAAYKVQNKAIKVNVGVQNTNLVITVSNYYESIKMADDNEFQTTKTDKGHGYGLRNIQQCVKKYNGNYEVKTENRMFTTKIILMDVVQ